MLAEMPGTMSEGAAIQESSRVKIRLREFYRLQVVSFSLGPHFLLTAIRSDSGESIESGSPESSKAFVPRHSLRCASRAWARPDLSSLTGRLSGTTIKGHRSSQNCPLVQRLGHLPLEQAIGVRIPGGQPNLLGRATSPIELHAN